ncbi:MAG: peptide-methionine (S)-S-oxide reductase MsrA [Pseudomonadota bacterium]
MFLTDLLRKKTEMVSADKALGGREQPIASGETHFVNGNSFKGPFPDHLEIAYLGLGCFWGAERLFWKLDGVFVTAVGYQGGFTPNPTYQETCTGQTGHAETVMVVFDPSVVSFKELLKVFFEEHDPTQGMRQGNDVGTTYRSAIYTSTDEQLAEAKAMVEHYQERLKAHGVTAAITTEVGMADTFFYAEEYHQQYLAKNPGGYCGLDGTGVSCPVPTGVSA